MSIDDLILLPHDQLDYKRLAAELLLELATQEDEPYIATSALAELAVRRVPETRAAAAAILDKKPWDRYLYAVAIVTLCKVDREHAIRKMAQLIEDTRDPEILGAMVECVLSDPDHFSTVPGAFTDRLAAKVETVEPDQFTDLDERAAFLSRYRGSGSPR